MGSGVCRFFLHRTHYVRTKVPDTTGIVWGHSRNLSRQDAISWLPLPGRTFVLGPIPRPVRLRKPGEKARNQALPAPRPLRASHSAALTAGSRPAGTPCPAGGTASPASRARGGAGLSLRQARRLPAARAPAAAGPSGSRAKRRRPGPGRPSRVPWVPRTPAPTWHGAHAAGARLGRRGGRTSLCGGGR